MAASTIKGITIEIGGDTTKLDKALSGVNKQSRDLQKELKEVEKGLETGSEKYGTSGTETDTSKRSRGRYF